MKTYANKVGDPCYQPPRVRVFEVHIGSALLQTSSNPVRDPDIDDGIPGAEDED